MRFSRDVEGVIVMAGFFGLFDYSKPGPGVAKDGPRKKGFVVFFEIYFRKFWKLITANLLFVLVSLPVVTVGFANAGLTYITRNFAREKHAFIYGDFMDAIKKNKKQAFFVGLINLLITVVIVFDIYFFWSNNSGEILASIMFALILSVALIFTFMKYYMNIMMITFKFTIKQMYKNSLILAFAGLKQNLVVFIVLLLLYAGGAALIYMIPAVGLPVVILVYIFMFPAFRSLLIQFNVFPVIKKFIIDPYYRDHPDEDKDAKKALNILEESEIEDEEEPIFVDTGVSDDPQPKSSFPRQYSDQEMERLRRKQKHNRNNDADDDGTI